MERRRILHVASSFGGGAGTAARRIVQAQRSVGLESHLVALSEGDLELSHYESTIDTTRFQRVQSKVLTALQAKVIQSGESLITSYSRSLVDEVVAVSHEFDIVNIHATYNVLDFSGICTIAESKPTVVTFHDQRFFTGGCHYSWDCIGYKSNCSNCPQVRLMFSTVPQRQLLSAVRSFVGSQSLSFVSPSKWLADLALSSRLLAESSVSVIANPIPFDLEQEVCRGVPEASKRVLRVGFVSKDLNNPYKGLDDLLRALEKVSENREVCLCLFGRGEVPKINSQFLIERSEFQTNLERNRALLSCDVVVVPSKQDNFPSVIGECLTLGVPVVTARVGGIQEVATEFNLPMFEPGDWIKLAQILTSHQGKRISPNTVSRARLKYSYSECGMNYIRKYESVLKTTKPLV